MNATQCVVSAVLRGAMFVPRQAAGRREPARVTPGAFKAAGLPVPEHRRSATSTSSPGGRACPGRPGLIPISAAVVANCSATDS